MAKQTKADTISVFNRLKSDVLAGKFAPIYLLMGEESYYVDLMCDLIQEHALQPYERDFNQTIVYGNETTALNIEALSNRFPMMAERQLVLVREAQQLKKIEDLETKVAPLVEKWIQEKGFCTPELTIKDVAAKIGTNQNYLSQYINNKLGLTFQVWLNTLRIEESKIILTSGTKKSIEEIGTMVGFSQIYNFSRWFRTVTGTTPLQYRKNK